MDALAAAGPGPCGNACDLGGGRHKASNRCGGPPPDDKPSLLRLVLRAIQGPGADREDPSRTLAAADGVRGTGDAGSRIAPGDLAFRDATRLERPHAELSPPGPAYGSLRAMERRSVGFRKREPALPGRGPETRHGAVPAAQVQADGRNLRLYAQRSSTSGVLVRRRLAPQAEDGL